MINDKNDKYYKALLNIKTIMLNRLSWCGQLTPFEQAIIIELEVLKDAD